MAASACQQIHCTTSWQHRTRTGARVQATCAASTKSMVAPANFGKSWTVPSFPALQLRSFCPHSVHRMPLVRPPLGARASKQEEPKKHILVKQETKSNLVQGQSSERSKSPLRPESLSIHGLSQGPRAVARSADVYPQPEDSSQVECAHGEAVKDGKSPVPLSGSLGNATCQDSRSSVAAKKGVPTLPESNVHTEHPGAERATSLAPVTSSRSAAEF
jgi:hypothetical protein